MAKTQEEIKALKDNWLKDPCWDIEVTEGFEDHFAELLLFRLEQQTAWQLDAEENIERRARVMEIETGVIATGAAQSLRTYSEIENAVERQTQFIYNLDNLQQQINFNIAQAQVRATLLLAAQTQRIADLIQAQMEDIELNRESDALTEVWKIK